MEYKRIMLVRPPSRCGWGFMWAPLAINLEYIAASIENDVEEIMIVNQEFDNTDITKHIKKFNPDFFGVTMSATDHITGLDLCRTAKKFGITTAVGGYHPTAIPDEMMKNPQIDMVMRGESEITMKELVKSGISESIDGITYRKDGKVVHNGERTPVADLDTLPFPARHYRAGNECDKWLKSGGSHRDQVHASRGCWGKCTFCCEPSMSHSKQRYRTARSVFDEIKEIYKFHNEERTVIIFGDPHFMGRPQLAEEISDLLIEADMDVIFTGMIRADTIARHPDVVAKMAKAGIIGYCMGIESPDQSDLNGTRKGITNVIQQKAVRTLRENHCVAGGTFVIGLPGQTEEEILTFPEYARQLGMINAAFAIATPQAGTEFYRDLDSKGLINVRDWTLYDQMHSVFEHDSISARRLEELLTMCLGRYYALDIFVDDMIESQYRNDDGRKITLRGALQHFKSRVDFILTAGSEYRPTEGKDYGMLFLKAQINPYTRLRMQKIGIHNMMDLEAFLRVFGDQKIMVRLTKDGVPFVHYVLKTTKKKVEYLDICKEPHDDATLTLELDLSQIHDSKGKIGLSVLSKIVKRGQLPTLIRGGLAMFVDHIAVTKPKKRTETMNLPPQYTKDGCVMSAWNPEEYKAITARARGSNNK